MTFDKSSFCDKQQKQEKNRDSNWHQTFINGTRWEMDHLTTLSLIKAAIFML
jgi:hypothetical protein